MTSNKNTQDEFYTGWQEKIPSGYRRPVRFFVISLFILFPLVALLIVQQQRGFANSAFEFGRQTVLEGTILKSPVPMFRIEEKGFYKHLILINFGKRGVAKLLPQIEEKLGQELDGQKVRIRGTLIYYDGQALLELTDQTEAIEEILGQGSPATKLSAIGEQKLSGEIVDPKCFFGAMKPGFGKPHRSCAALCLKGGMPAILAVKTKDGGRRYCIILDENGELMNEKLYPVVGEAVEMQGRLVQMDDWYLFYAKSNATRQLSFNNLKSASNCKD